MLNVRFPPLADFRSIPSRCYLGVMWNLHNTCTSAQEVAAASRAQIPINFNASERDVHPRGLLASRPIG